MILVVAAKVSATHHGDLEFESQMRARRSILSSEVRGRLASRREAVMGDFAGPYLRWWSRRGV